MAQDTVWLLQHKQNNIRQKSVENTSQNVFSLNIYFIHT